MHKTRNQNQRPAVNLTQLAGHNQNHSSIFGPPMHDGPRILSEFFNVGQSADFSTDEADSSSMSSGYDDRPCIRILKQPEDRHRARYMSEGSRGAVKDKTGMSHVTIQLAGYNRPTAVNVYAGVDGDSAGPHPLYRVIRVNGKGSNGARTTPCSEHVDSNGVNYLQIMLRPESQMTAVLDCVGILKVCAHAIKRRLNRDKKQSVVRLVFMAEVPARNGGDGTENIQTISAPIQCMQQLGHPEIVRCSLDRCSASGGKALFIIGRNFDRTTVVLFREYKNDGKLAWSAEATMDRQNLHQCHLVCSVPTYRSINLNQPIEVSFTVKCDNKTSHPVPFFYLPNDDRNPTSRSRPGPSASKPAGVNIDDWAPPDGASQTAETPSPVSSVVTKTESYHNLYSSPPEAVSSPPQSWRYDSSNSGFNTSSPMSNTGHPYVAPVIIQDPTYMSNPNPTSQPLTNGGVPTTHPDLHAQSRVNMQPGATYMSI